MARQIYDPETHGGSEVAQFVQNLLNVIEQGDRLVSKLNSTTVAGTAYSNIEIGGSFAAVFGVAAGNGEAFYNLLAQASIGIVSKLNAANLKAALADLDMG